jgi:hypothetical protein
MLLNARLLWRPPLILRVSSPPSRAVQTTDAATTVVLPHLPRAHGPPDGVLGRRNTVLGVRGAAHFSASDLNPRNLRSRDAGGTNAITDPTASIMRGRGLFNGREGVRTSQDGGQGPEGGIGAVDGARSDGCHDVVMTCCTFDPFIGLLMRGVGGVGDSPQIDRYALHKGPAGVQARSVETMGLIS